MNFCSRQFESIWYHLITIYHNIWQCYVTGVPISGKIKSILLWFWLWLYRVPSIWPITFIFCKTSNSHRSPTIQFSFWDSQTIWLLTSIEVLIGPWRWRWNKPSKGQHPRFTPQLRQSFHTSRFMAELSVYCPADGVGPRVKLTRKSWTGEVRSLRIKASQNNKSFSQDV